MLTVVSAVAALAQPAGQPATVPAPPPDGAVASKTPPPPGPSLRSPARDELLSTVGLTCAFGPGTSEADARRQCFLKARTRLTVKMVQQVRSQASALGLSLTDEELLAFTLGVVRVEADREELEPAGDGFVIRLTGRAVADLAGLRSKLPFFADSPDVRAAAVAQWRASMAEAEMAARSAGDPAEEQAAKTRRAMAGTARFAERQLRLGMSQADVRGLLGEPGPGFRALPARISRALAMATYGRCFRTENWPVCVPGWNTAAVTSPNATVRVAWPPSFWASNPNKHIRHKIPVRAS